MQLPSIKELIKDNEVKFDSFRANNFFYTIEHLEHTYIFPVPLDDIGMATMQKLDKAIFFMRWIRKAIDDGTFTEL